MQLNNIDEVAHLRQERNRGLTVLAAVAAGTMEMTVRANPEGPRIDILPATGHEAMRAAVAMAAADRIAEIDARLQALGVATPAFEHPGDSMERWRATAEMYARAWQRELGPRRPKTHLIDELVVGTQELRARAEQKPPLKED